MTITKEREAELLEIIEDLCYQFAYEGGPVNGNPTLFNGGLSALEDAFEALGWADVHPIPDSKCDELGCSNRANCGTPSPTGYRRVCGDHYRAI